MSPSHITLADGSICLNELYEQRYRRKSNSGSKPNESDKRTPTEKDRDRIAYSGYFQRLAGVTQVISPHLEAVYLHNRQSHSYKVALLAKEIANDLLRKVADDQELLDTLLVMGGLDIAACEAAGLAHDIGHPPFGHVSEVYLKNFLSDPATLGTDGKEEGTVQSNHKTQKFQDDNLPYVINGFEGNAQSLRVVSYLDRRRVSRERGLDLTAVTLCGILKYPWVRLPGDPKRDDKYGAYKDEDGILQLARTAVPEGFDPLRQSIEASIMDLADDITYAMHDLEDFYFAGLLHTDEILRELDYATSLLNDDERVPASVPNTFIEQSIKLNHHYAGFYKEDLYAQSIVAARQFLGEFKDRYSGSPHDVGTTRQWVGDRIGEYLRAVKVSAEPKWEHGPVVYMEQHAWHEVQVMKTISKRFIVQTPKVSLHERSQLGALRSLVKIFLSG